MAAVSTRPDAVCAGATDLAHEAALAVGGEAVGEALGLEADGERVVTHRFAATLPGYRGWHWAVTIARASRSRTPTVDEVVLLPGPDALLAPQWVPWSERVRPGDLSPGDVIPGDPDDPRLVPAWFAGDPSLDDADSVDDPAADERAVADDLAVGRVRVLSPEGRSDAAERWRDGDGGPDTPMARQAPGPCATCAFLIPLRGSLRGGFGVCANEFSPSDGRAVTVDHGCGAHSDAVAEETHHSEPTGEVYDDAEIVVEPT